MINYVKVEKAVAPHSSTLAWKIPWMEEPGGLPHQFHSTLRLYTDSTLNSSLRFPYMLATGSRKETVKDFGAI